MANFFNILKRLFVEEVDVPEEENDTSPEENYEQGKGSVDLEQETEEAAPEGDEGEVPDELLEKFRNIFQQTLDEHNKEGFDYLEFRHSLKSMQNISDDEETCFQSIFATAKTLGATKDSLMESIEYYRDVLQEEEHKFKRALKKQKSKRRETMDQRLEGIREDIQQKREKIESLKKEIQEEEQEARQIEQMIARSNQKIHQTRKAFNRIHERFIEQMEADKKKMEDYLDNGNRDKS